MTEPKIGRIFSRIRKMISRKIYFPYKSLQFPLPTKLFYPVPIHRHIPCSPYLHNFGVLKIPSLLGNKKYAAWNDTILIYKRVDICKKLNVWPQCFRAFILSINFSTEKSNIFCNSNQCRTFLTENFFCCIGRFY